MTIFQAVILGIVQGLTEFLPISSSGHLVIVPFLLQWKLQPEIVFSFDVLVQMGTLAAVIVYFWKDLIEIAVAFIRGLIERRPFDTYASRLGWYLILATIPASLAGLLIKDAVEQAFHSPIATACFLLVTAAILVLAEYLGKRQRPLQTMTWKDAVWVGCSQIASLFPGVSRSGATIAGGLLRNFNRADAGRFSFLMSIPVMVGAGGLSILDLFDIPNLSSFLLPLLLGTLAAAVVGFLAIHWLLRYLTQHSLRVFAIYCAIAGMITLVVAYVR
ncbi:MAG: undecaprenyl-diphosphatase UppP [Chloroflexi bacterium]|nr:undecaprenyl-diphosphatase UppP [Chloroflexota bacterium]